MIYHYLPQRKASDIKDKTMGGWPRHAISQSKGSLLPVSIRGMRVNHVPLDVIMSTEQGYGRADSQIVVGT